MTHHPKFKGFIFALILVGLMGMACNRGESEEIIAEVGSSELSRIRMQDMMIREGMNPDQESDFVDRWVNRELLFQEAQHLGLDKSEDLKWELELVEKEFLIQKLLEIHFAEKVQISDEEIAAYYEENKELFQVGQDEVRLQHILTATREEADRAHQEIQTGRSFEDVVGERSTGIFRDQGGNMGFINRDDVITEISRVAFRLAEGRVSSVIQSAYGYHIMKVLKKRSEGDFKALTDMHDEILERLMISKERAVYYDLLYDLQNKAKVHVSVPQDVEGGNSRSPE